MNAVNFKNMNFQEMYLRHELFLVTESFFAQLSEIDSVGEFYFRNLFSVMDSKTHPWSTLIENNQYWVVVVVITQARFELLGNFLKAVFKLVFWGI